MNTRQLEINALGKIIQDIDNSGVAEFNDWQWAKKFDNLEEATGFLLGHLKRTRELLKYGLIGLKYTLLTGKILQLVF